MKICSKCGCEFDPERKHAWCKPCAAAYLREFRAKNPGYDKRPGRTYVKCSGCGIDLPAGSKTHRCQDCNRAHVQKFRDEKPEQAREIERKRYERDKKKRLAYYQTIRPRQAQRQRDRYAEDPTYWKLKEHRYRSRKVQAGGQVTPDQIRDLIAACGGKCSYCGIETSGRNQCIDHIRPITRGGDNAITNLQILCLSCNSRKGNRLEEEIADWLGELRGGGQPLSVEST